jgi:hypothetical protein
MEDQHGGAARGVAGLRHQGEIHRVLGVFAGDNQPHVEVAFFHQPRQKRVQAFLKHAVFGFDAIARSEHRTGRSDHAPLCEIAVR